MRSPKKQAGGTLELSPIFLIVFFVVKVILKTLF